MKNCLLFFFGLLPFLLDAQDSSILKLLTAFKPAKDLPKGTAVIVCSGGAYAFRSDAGEGIPTCKLLQQNGITAFLLDYNLPKGNDTVPLHDALAAINFIRINSKVYNIDPHKIGILGFSAGGHLASSAGTHFHDENDRPDFMVLIYPVISFADSITHKWSRTELLGKNITQVKIKLYSNELQVIDSTSGSFIAHAMDDEGVPVANSLYFQAALSQHHVPNQIFLYAHGGHAFDIHNRTADVQWTEECIPWIKEMKWRKQ